MSVSGPHDDPAAGGKAAPPFVVAFEVRPFPTKMASYLERARLLRPDLDGVDGFISVERFACVDDPGRLLSLSIWRDEMSLASWRSHRPHQAAQDDGRRRLFEDYRIRVGQVVGGADESLGRPGVRGANATGFDAASHFLLVDLPEDAPDHAFQGQGRRFRSLYNPDRRLLLDDLPMIGPVAGDAEQMSARIGAYEACAGVRFVAVKRDYGLRSRAQAPETEDDSRRS